MIALYLFGKKIICHIFLLLCHIMLSGSSGMNCEFIYREYGFSINSKISFASSGKPILILKISVTNFCRFHYFADFYIKIVLLGQYSSSEKPSVKLSVVHFKPTLKPLLPLSLALDCFLFLNFL